MQPIEPPSQRPPYTKSESGSSKKEELQQLQEEIDIQAVGTLCATMDHNRGVDDSGKSPIQKKVEKSLDLGKLSGAEALHSMASMLNQQGIPTLLGLPALSTAQTIDPPMRIMIHLQSFAFFLYDKLPQNPTVSIPYHKVIEEAKKLSKHITSPAESAERLKSLIEEANRFLRASERYPLIDIQ